MRLHHVQVACPPGGEAAARRFSFDAHGNRVEVLAAASHNSGA